MILDDNVMLLFLVLIVELLHYTLHLGRSTMRQVMMIKLGSKQQGVD